MWRLLSSDLTGTLQSASHTGAERLAHGRGAVVAVVGRGRWRLDVWFAALNRNIFLWIITYLILFAEYLRLSANGFSWIPKEIVPSK